jgi:hypothetical protein
MSGQKRTWKGISHRLADDLPSGSNDAGFSPLSQESRWRIQVRLQLQVKKARIIGTGEVKT